MARFLRVFGAIVVLSCAFLGVSKFEHHRRYMASVQQAEDRIRRNDPLPKAGALSKIPCLLVVADADRTVDPKQNGLALQKSGLAAFVRLSAYPARIMAIIAAMPRPRLWLFCGRIFPPGRPSSPCTEPTPARRKILTGAIRTPRFPTAALSAKCCIYNMKLLVEQWGGG